MPLLFDGHSEDDGDGDDHDKDDGDDAVAVMMEMFMHDDDGREGAQLLTKSH